MGILRPARGTALHNRSPRALARGGALSGHITRVKLQEILLTGAAAVPHLLGVSLTALTQQDSSIEVRFRR
jgi:hypothetical protein